MRQLIYISWILVLVLSLTHCASRQRMEDDMALDNEDGEVTEITEEENCDPEEEVEEKVVESGFTERVEDGVDAGVPAPPAKDYETSYFPFDSAVLTSSAIDAINQNMTQLRQNPNVPIQLEGHCDERGTTEYNLALGERRAVAVKNYLVRQGVPASQVSTISYGKERPAEVGHNESSWSKNRRVNFVNLQRMNASQPQ